MKLLNGLDYKGQYLLSLDWSRPQVVVYDGRTDTVEKFKTFEEVAQKHPGCSLVFEATAESFELDRRQEVLDALAAANIDAYTYNTRFTAKFRDKHDIKKTDANDAKVIYRIATETTLALKRFGPLRRDDVLGKKISKWAIEDRCQCSGEGTLAMTEKYFGSLAPKKRDRLASVYWEFQEFLFDAQTEYRKPIGKILYAAEQVRKAGRGWREFERQLGTYSNGYPRIMRSEVNHHLVKTISGNRIRAEDYPAFGEPADENKIRKEVRKQAVKFIKYLWKLTASVEKEPDTLCQSAVC